MQLHEARTPVVHTVSDFRIIEWEGVMFPAPPSHIPRHHELSTSSVCLDYFFSVMHT
jgi:hypothetical protein